MLREGAPDNPGIDLVAAAMGPGKHKPRRGAALARPFALLEVKPATWLHNEGRLGKAIVVVDSAEALRNLSAGFTRSEEVRYAAIELPSSKDSSFVCGAAQHDELRGRLLRNACRYCGNVDCPEGEASMLTPKFKCWSCSKEDFRRKVCESGAVEFHAPSLQEATEFQNYYRNIEWPEPEDQENGSVILTLPPDYVETFLLQHPSCANHRNELVPFRAARVLLPLPPRNADQDKAAQRHKPRKGPDPFLRFGITLIGLINEYKSTGSHDLKARLRASISIQKAIFERFGLGLTNRTGRVKRLAKSGRPPKPALKSAALRMNRATSGTLRAVQTLREAASLPSGGTSVTIGPELARSMAFPVEVKEISELLRRIVAGPLGHRGAQWIHMRSGKRVYLRPNQFGTEEEARKWLNSLREEVHYVGCHLETGHAVLLYRHPITGPPLVACVIVDPTSPTRSLGVCSSQQGRLQGDYDGDCVGIVCPLTLQDAAMWLGRLPRHMHMHEANDQGKPRDTLDPLATPVFANLLGDGGADRIDPIPRMPVVRVLRSEAVSALGGLCSVRADMVRPPRYWTTQVTVTFRQQGGMYSLKEVLAGNRGTRLPFLALYAEDALADDCGGLNVANSVRQIEALIAEAQKEAMKEARTQSPGERSWLDEVEGGVWRVFAYSLANELQDGFIDLEMRAWSNVDEALEDAVTQACEIIRRCRFGFLVQKVQLPEALRILTEFQTGGGQCLQEAVVGCKLNNLHGKELLSLAFANRREDGRIAVMSLPASGDMDRGRIRSRRCVMKADSTSALQYIISRLLEHRPNREQCVEVYVALFDEVMPPKSPRHCFYLELLEQLRPLLDEGANLQSLAMLLPDLERLTDPRLEPLTKILRAASAWAPEIPRVGDEDGSSYELVAELANRLQVDLRLVSDAECPPEQAPGGHEGPLWSSVSVTDYYFPRQCLDVRKRASGGRGTISEDISSIVRGMLLRHTPWIRMYVGLLTSGPCVPSLDGLCEQAGALFGHAAQARCLTNLHILTMRLSMHLLPAAGMEAWVTLEDFPIRFVVQQLARAERWVLRKMRDNMEVDFAVLRREMHSLFKALMNLLGKAELKGQSLGKLAGFLTVDWDRCTNTVDVICDGTVRQYRRLDGSWSAEEGHAVYAHGESREHQDWSTISATEVSGKKQWLLDGAPLVEGQMLLALPDLPLPLHPPQVIPGPDDRLVGELLRLGNARLRMRKARSDAVATGVVGSRFFEKGEATVMQHSPVMGDEGLRPTLAHGIARGPSFSANVMSAHVGRDFQEVMEINALNAVIDGKTGVEKSAVHRRRATAVIASLTQVGKSRRICGDYSRHICLKRLRTGQICAEPLLSLGNFCDACARDVLPDPEEDTCGRRQIMPAGLTATSPLQLAHEWRSTLAPAASHRAKGGLPEFAVQRGTGIYFSPSSQPLDHGECGTTTVMKGWELATHPLRQTVARAFRGFVYVPDGPVLSCVSSTTSKLVAQTPQEISEQTFKLPGNSFLLLQRSRAPDLVTEPGETRNYHDEDESVSMMRKILSEAEIATIAGQEGEEPDTHQMLKRSRSEEESEDVQAPKAARVPRRTLREGSGEDASSFSSSSSLSELGTEGEEDEESEVDEEQQKVVDSSE